MTEDVKQKLLLMWSSGEYKKFNESNHEFRKRVIGWLRVGLSAIIICYCFSHLYLSESTVSEQVLYPLLFCVNLFFSSMLQKRVMEKFCSLYLSIWILILFGIGIHIELHRANTANSTIFSGLGLGLFCSIFVLSKLPSSYFFILSLFLTVFLIYATLETVMEAPIISLIKLLLFLLIPNNLYLRQESLEFKIWKDLQRSLQSMQCFHELIEIFPSEIIILNQRSWVSDSIFYLNHEAKKKLGEFQADLSIHRFLAQFAIEKVTLEQSGRLSSLNELITELFATGTIDSPSKFQNLIATLRPENFDHSKEQPNELDPLKNASSLRSLTNDSINNTKYEIKIGKIEWGGDNAVILILTDISASEKIRELFNLHENKDKVLATVSHELRTPLNGIIGMLDIIEEKTVDLDSKTKKYITIARNSARTLLLMINDILDISQIQKGKLSLNITTAPLHNLIDEVLPLVEIQIQKKGLQLIYENSLPKDTRVRCDPMRFQQILLNLLSNACKFTDFGSIKIKAEPIFDQGRESRELELLIEPKSAVVISVADTGIGIKEENINHLFKLFGKFEQRGNTTGVGLGLAISQKLAQQMHPKGISVSSTYGRGTCFWFFLNQISSNDFEEGNSDLRPKVLSSKYTHFFESKISKTENSIPSQKMVLVVDDDQINQIVLSKYLASFEYFSVHRASNGQEALDIVEKKAKQKAYFDIVFMDCNMPVMDGFVATRRIKELIRQRALPDIMIIAMTANVSAADKKLCLESGMHDVWDKPLHKKDFLSKMGSLMTQNKNF